MPIKLQGKEPHCGGGVMSDDKRLMDFDDYTRLDGINWSRLKLMETSPKHYRFTPPSESSAAMQLGTYLHALLLEPETVEDRFVVYSGESTRNSKDYKEFAAQHPDKTIFSTSVKSDVQALKAADSMLKAVRAHPQARVLLANGVPEVALLWTEMVDGEQVNCKGLVDWMIEQPSEAQIEMFGLPEDGRILVDIKTARDVSRLSSTMTKLGYYGQLAHYRRGMQAMGGADPLCIILWIESSPPYDVAVTVVGPMSLDAGERWRTDLLRRVVECTRADDWPGVAPGVALIDVEQWAPGLTQDDDFSFAAGA